MSELTSRHSLADRCASPISIRVQTRLPGQAGGVSKYHCSVNKAHDRAVFENNREKLWGCADRTMCFSTRDVVCFACFSRRNHRDVCPGERSILREAEYAKAYLEAKLLP